MRFDMYIYWAKFLDDYSKKGCIGMPWELTFERMGYKTYQHLGHLYDEKPHYLSAEEFNLFVLRYS